MIPAGITTAVVHLDAPVSFIGDPGRIHITIAPSVPLVWTATGTALGNFVDNISLNPGAELIIELPHTDQDGFEDGEGNAYTGWYYTVTIVYEKDGQRIDFPAKDFQILAGQNSVDLALVPAGNAAPVPEIAPILPVTSLEGFTGAVTLADLDLELVDNTPDAAKPISTATQAALDLKAPINNPTFTGTVGGVSKAMVGLGSVDNTTDLLKPISTATQTALNGKAPTVHGHTYADISGMVPTAALPPLAINETFPVASQAAMLALVAQRGDVAIRTDVAKSFILSTDSPGTLADWKEFIATGQVVSVAGKTGVVALVKADVGLGSVDNTADTAKPVSVAQAAALALKVDKSEILGQKVFTPEYYGAVGDSDGSTGTNDTAAVQAAINAAVAAGGRGVVKLSKAYLIPGGITVNGSCTILGEGAGELHGGTAVTAATLVNVTLPSVGSRFTLRGVRRITKPDTGTGTVLSLTNVRGTIEDMTITGGDTALFVGPGTNETFFAKLLLKAKTRVLDTVIDSANAENSWTNIRIFGAGTAVQSAIRATSVNGGDIGAWYMTDVVAAMSGSNCQVGLELSGAGAPSVASHPFFLVECAFDGVVLPFSFTRWGNIQITTSWTYATGPYIFKFNGCNDIILQGNLLKGSTTAAFRFEGASSSIITDANNRFPDAVQLYNFDPATSVSSLVPGRNMQTSGAATTNDLVKFVTACRRPVPPILTATKFLLDSNHVNGDLLFINELSQVMRLRAASGAIEWRNADGGEVEHSLGHTGIFKSRVSIAGGRYSTATRPSAATVGAGGQITDADLNKPLWSDGAVWRDAMGTAV
jgi:hypothetical protein